MSSRYLNVTDRQTDTHDILWLCGIATFCIASRGKNQASLSLSLRLHSEQ